MTDVEYAFEHLMDELENIEENEKRELYIKLRLELQQRLLV